jgi:hypothetical protein
LRAGLGGLRPPVENLDLVLGAQLCHDPFHGGKALFQAVKRALGPAPVENAGILEIQLKSGKKTFGH